MTILLATNNDHKRREFSEILPEWTILCPADVGRAGWDHDETADTFVGNALGKAQALWRESGGVYPVLADDSGLCVDALGGGPGVYSARYGSQSAGRPLTDHEKNLLLLKNMEGHSHRRARFVACLALIVTEHRFFTVQEAWEGIIAHSIEGVNGFGYDPLFVLPELGCSSAQLPRAEKNRLSHRSRACRRLQALIADDLEIPLKEHP